MNKIVAFILLSINLNMFSMEKEQGQIKTPAQEQQLTKKDIVKIGVAALGFVAFTASSALSYHSGCRVKAEKMIFALDILPAMTAVLPLFIIEKSMIMLGRSDPKDYRTNVAFVVGGIISGGLALGCISYIYKKISSLKEANRTDNA